MSLDASSFVAFYEGIYGYPPFPWQSRLAADILGNGTWPDVLALPTGSGKTCTLDIALFCLACDPMRFARRIVMVVDRRVVVDQGAEHAKRLRTALSNPTNEIVETIANRLRQTWGADAQSPPFEIAVMRGGMPRDDAWARRPDCPVIGVSTVDQVGSRLLFRGYGVGERMSSVHAGLLGHDTLILLDEVHLSVPFAQTTLALRNTWRGYHASPLADRWGVVRLSATPGLTQTEDVEFTIDEADRANATLNQRLAASKPVALQTASGTGDEPNRRDRFSAAITKQVNKVLGDHSGAIDPVRVVGVVVNRVDTAQRIAAGLINVEINADVVLLTGRMRPLDRDRILEPVLPRIRAGRTRHIDDPPIVVVATQCIEAGADFDFDALISECASLDALRQRFGRLDRLGELGETQSWIFIRKDQINSDDPVYGQAMSNTWNWLNTLQSAPDFGIERLPVPDGDALGPLLSPAPDAPIMLPSHIDAWAHTHPRPYPDPDIGLWLHGPKRGQPEVQLVWRADISEQMLKDAMTENTADDTLDIILARLNTAVPSALESLSLPRHVAIQWLQHQQPDSVADAVSNAPEPSNQKPNRRTRPFVLWRGEETRVNNQVAEIQEGSVLIVPSAYGGIDPDTGNWSPESPELVRDLADLAQWRQRSRAVLRIDPQVLVDTFVAHSVEMPNWANSTPDLTSDITDRALLPQIEAWLATVPASGIGQDIVNALVRSNERAKPKFRIVRTGDTHYAIVALQRSGPVGSEASSEDDTASFINQRVTLKRHLKDVWDWVADFASNLKLPAELASDLALAAWLHDVGKADPRFQRWMVGGSAVRFEMLDEWLAKSNQTHRDRGGMERARKRSGYPKGYRHELLSVAMLQNNSMLLEVAHDLDLVLHLVGSHHGWCRPFAPAMDSLEDIPVNLTLDNGPAGLRVELEAGTRHCLARLDSGVSDRFWTLTERYGWWGLAYLEAILRLADHRASEQEEDKNVQL